MTTAKISKKVPKKAVPKVSPKSMPKTRGHWFLVIVFILILLIGLAVLIFRTDFQVVAGEAIRQRVAETKQLALTKVDAKVAQAIRENQGTIFQDCPLALYPANEQHWKLEEGWHFWQLNSVAAQCADHRVFCYYADESSEISRADQVVTYLDIPKAKNCQYGESGPYRGCYCNIKQ